ncbi:hypothetical protein CBR_g12046 [Chara braunii]|uniref:fructokinase n=1 Tax=Chara braunii TaxID=69332 RepID=A0A388KQX5_CHABU|nr:hypothetical protein CBR_g12046 [Chara braunii]|eukprot:GBG72471.1 hypothetical protein CBR_g12046 [Chara braunii]
MGFEAAAAPLIVSFGELLIDFVPTENGLSLAEAPAFKKAPGGAPANVAVGIAKLGGKVAFIGKVGEDEFGRMLAGVLESNNVDVSGMTFDKNARTALAFVTLKMSGEREFMFYRNPSADMLLTPAELDRKLIADAAIFHYGSISLITEPCRSAHVEAMKIAKAGGAILSYDPNLRLPLWPSAEAAKEGILSIWNEADIIKVSDEELMFLTGAKEVSEKVARSLWHDGLKLLLVTRGEEGADYYTKTLGGHVDSFKVKAIDTTGAGDAFVAGLLVRAAADPSILEDEAELKSTLRFACAAGAITTTERGAIPALPTPDAVLALLAKEAAI